MTKREECLKALQCLYLEVAASIADDVKRKVLDALDEANKNFVQPDVIKSVCLCVEAAGEEIGWTQKRHCNRCDKVIEQTVL